MQIVNILPELKQMLRNFILFVIVSPILAYALMQFVGYFKKYWNSGSKLKRWYVLTITVLAFCIIFIGL